ncbi:hypothetical protein H632_c841p0 [Helicosporidium sp. ATCC 50920]|nr:hypothetical protein H632_c841p0 [Helicosporidium sp. ATCC 50920]|eukprot:KDD75149.1 hypothetical protein H632_c841p0 [Helicosporidium sp. ATCC 50920]
MAASSKPSKAVHGALKVKKSAKSVVAKPKPTAKPLAANEKKTEQASKAAVSEIDDLFGSLKGKTLKPATANAEDQATVAPKENSVKKAVVGSKNDIFGTEQSSGRKKTEEGFSIFSEDELRLKGKGGDTDLCPFDCDCCY